MYEVLLGAVVVLYLIYKYVHRSHLGHIPGPMTWPIMGNTLEVEKNNPYLTYIELSKKWGKIFRLRVTGTDVVVVSDKDAIKDICVTQGKSFADKPKMLRLGLSTLEFSGLAFMDYGEKYLFLRKIHSVGLQNHNLDKVEEIAMGAGKIYLDACMAQGGKVFDPYETVHRMLYKISMYFVLGEKAVLSEKQRLLIEKGTSLLVDVYRPHGRVMDALPWLRHFNTQLMQNIRGQKHLIRQIYEGFQEQVPMDEPTKAIFPETRKAFMNGQGGVTEENLMVFSVAEGAVAGILSTMSTFYSVLNKMAHWPEVQAKVQAEIEKVIGDRTVTLKDRDSMPYTHATMLDILRIDSTSPVTRSHRTRCDTNVGPYKVPAGTDVLINFWALHHDPELWERPLELYPDHYLDASGQMLPPGVGVRAADFTFGAGARGCPAMAYAKCIVFLLLTATCQKFTIKPATTIAEQVSCDSRDFIPGLVTRPPRFTFRMIPRCPAA